MLRFAWIVLIVAICIALEVWLVQYGILFPSAFLICLYIGISLSWKLALFYSGLAVLIVEITLMRSMTALPLLFVIILFAMFWKRHGDRRLMMMQIIPATFIGIFYAMYVVIGENIHLRSFSILIPFSTALALISLSVIANVILLPVTIKALDLLAACMQLETFHMKRKISAGLNDD